MGTIPPGVCVLSSYVRGGLVRCYCHPNVALKVRHTKYNSTRSLKKPYAHVLTVYGFKIQRLSYNFVETLIQNVAK